MDGKSNDSVHRGLIHLYSPVDCHLHKGRDTVSTLSSSN